MTQQTYSILDRIVSDVREKLEATMSSLPLAQLKARLDEVPPPKPFVQAIRAVPAGRQGQSISLIAEVKKASPSRGTLRADFDPIALASAYAQAGAAAISVLTESKHFGGSLEHLQDIREALDGDGRPPLLRKDFLFDAYQLYEARVHGADAVLLIAAILDHDLLAQLIALAPSLSLAALVEVHDERELEHALTAGADLIGINNRDLRTFEVDLATSEQLRALIPPEATVVAESGIHTRADVLRLQEMGVHAVLVGEALVTAPDPAAKIRELIG